MNDDDPPRVLAAVGERLATLRIERGLTLEDLAARAAIDPERLAGAEAAEIALREDELQRLADACDVGVTALFGGRVTPFNYLAGA